VNDGIFYIITSHSGTHQFHKNRNAGCKAIRFKRLVLV